MRLVVHRMKPQARPTMATSVSWIEKRKPLRMKLWMMFQSKTSSPS